MWLVFVQGWDDVGNGFLFGVEEVGGKGQSWEREVCVYEVLCCCYFGDGGLGDFVYVGVFQCLVVYVYGLYGVEIVQVLQVVYCGREGVYGLQEGVIGELQ